MQFQDAYQYLLSLSNIPRKEYMRDPRHCGVYMKRLQFFLDILGNPEKKIPHYIHVTGTSGKGSTTAFFHGILSAAGTRVASTYSPHPSCITERWKIGNRYMKKSEFSTLVARIRPALQTYIETSPYDMLSFYEIMEAMGFVFFAEQKVQWLVMEAACGGRYDSSNVLPYKDAAVITNIGLDHVGVIGNNKSEIAHEKAGIVMQGVPTFTAERSAAMRKIIQRECQKKRSAFFVVDAAVSDISLSFEGTRFTYEGTTYQLPAAGKHQISNALLCLHTMRELGFEDAAIQKGLARADQPLRLEVLQERPYIIVDGAHNPDKIASTVETLQALAGKRRVHLMVGFCGDKQRGTMLKSLASLKPKSVACTRNTMNPFRKVVLPQTLKKEFKKYSPKAAVQAFIDPAAALAWSKKQLKKDDILLVTGSIYLSGEVRAHAS